MGKFSEFVENEDNIKIDNKEQEISDLIEKYSAYSEAELMDEFVQESARKRQNGELDDKKVQQIENILSPYLSSEQKEKLASLLNSVK